MGRIYRWAVVLIALLGAVSAGAQTIVGSKHDFSTQGWAGGQICIVCHTPHNAVVGADPSAPLWNHADTAVTTFTMYSSDTFNGSATIGTQPGGRSKACLSCHDGTVALDSFGGNTGTTFLTGRTLMGSDLTDDHPVSFVYDDALAAADGQLHPPSTTSSGVGPGTISQDLLFGDRLECASCHDVHNSYSLPGVPGMLLKTNTGSALCLTCHNK
jgi:predicted CXXCH cytochrome family protein